MINGYAKAVRILLKRMYSIFKCILQVRKISARWIPHVLIYDQNRYPSLFLKFRQFSTIATGIKNGFSISNQQETKHGKLHMVKVLKTSCH